MAKEVVKAREPSGANTYEVDKVFRSKRPASPPDVTVAGDASSGVRTVWISV